MSGELPTIESKKSLFAFQVSKKQAETEAQKIMNRIAQLRMEHEKLIKKISLDDQRAEEIYLHRLHLQQKKEEKLLQKKAQPPPFSLQVSRQQKETLKKIKEENINRKKTEARLFRDILKRDHKETLHQKSLDHETYRTKVIQVKDEERQSTFKAVEKLQEKRNRVRQEVEYEKQRIINEKVEYDRMIAELERQEHEAMIRLQQTMERQEKINQKVQEAQKLPPKEFEKAYVQPKTSNNTNNDLSSSFNKGQ